MNKHHLLAQTKHVQHGETTKEPNHKILFVFLDFVRQINTIYYCIIVFGMQTKRKNKPNRSSHASPASGRGAHIWIALMRRRSLRTSLKGDQNVESCSGNTVGRWGDGGGYGVSVFFSSLDMGGVWACFFFVFDGLCFFYIGLSSKNMVTS